MAGGKARPPGVTGRRCASPHTPHVGPSASHGSVAHPGRCPAGAHGCSPVEASPRLQHLHPHSPLDTSAPVGDAARRASHSARAPHDQQDQGPERRALPHQTGGADHCWVWPLRSSVSHTRLGPVKSVRAPGAALPGGSGSAHHVPTCAWQPRAPSHSTLPPPASCPNVQGIMMFNYGLPEVTARPWCSQGWTRSGPSGGACPWRCGADGSQGRRGAKCWLPVRAPELTTGKFTVGSEPFTSCELGFSATHGAQAHQNSACAWYGDSGGC